MHDLPPRGVGRLRRYGCGHVPHVLLGESQALRPRTDEALVVPGAVAEDRRRTSRSTDKKRRSFS